VHLAIRKLLDTTNHIQARAAELENALEALREQERSKAVKELLLALRNSPDGDLLRFTPAAPGNGGNSTAQAIIAALVEAFSIVPIRNIGEHIAVRDGHIPDTLELDRSIGDEPQNCIAAEVISVGWSYKNHTRGPPSLHCNPAERRRGVKRERTTWETKSSTPPSSTWMKPKLSTLNHQLTSPPTALAAAAVVLHPFGPSSRGPRSLSAFEHFSFPAFGPSNVAFLQFPPLDSPPPFVHNA
jgi:hypothetical protein